MTQKERIVEQAMQMFVSQGIKSVRMDDIAQQLSVSKRTLYEQFGDKEELLYQAMLCYYEQGRLKWSEHSMKARNVLEKMFIALGDVMDRSEVTNRMMDNLKKFYPEVHHKLMHEGLHRNRMEFRVLLEKGVEEGLFIDSFNIDLAISVLYHTATAMVARKDLILPSAMSEREAFVQVITNFFRGISTTKGIELVDDCLHHHDLTHPITTLKTH